MLIKLCLIDRWDDVFEFQRKKAGKSGNIRKREG